jgi:putative DNA primase/helicase
MNIAEKPDKLKHDIEVKSDLIVSAIRYSSPVGKPYGYQNGTVIKGKNHRPPEATGETLAFKTFDEFADWRKLLTPDYILVSGTFDNVVCGVPVVYKGDERPGEVSASKAYLHHRELPGILIIDVDFKDADEVAGLHLGGGQPYKTHEAALEVLSTILPEGDHCALMIGWSTSSNLFIGAVQVKGTGGIRIYIPVTDASQIPRLLEIMQRRSWLHGEGWAFVDKAGGFQERSFVDLALARTTQPDFAAPDLKDSLTQDREWKVYDGAYLDPSNVPSLTPKEETEYRQARDAVKEELAPAMAAQKMLRLEEKTDELVKSGVKRTRAKAAAIQLLDHGVLFPIGSVIFDDGTEASIKELLTNGSDHDGKTCLDPVEPDYNDGASVAKYYWNEGQRPGFHSYAHGSRWYEIKYDADSLKELIEGADKDEIVRGFALCQIDDAIEYAQLEAMAARALQLGSAREPLRKSIKEQIIQMRGTTPVDGSSADDDEAVLDPNEPTVIAEKFLRSRFTEGQTQTLVEHFDDFHDFNGTHYEEVRATEIRAALYEYLMQANKRTNDGLVPFNPKMNAVTEVLDAVKSKVHISSRRNPPFWIDGRQTPVPDELLVASNGLLNIPSGELLPHDASLFSLNSLAYAYDVNAPEPEKFFEFLDDLFGEDEQSRDLLQEMFGYILSGASSLQKILMIVGPKRSGKGTLGRVLVELVGAANSCSPRLESLGGRFGLQPLIGKKLCYMSDVRLDGLAKQQTIAENLLRISGEDDVNAERKNRSDWFGRLPIRFMMLSNMVPRIADPSGALAGRFSMLVLKNSFFGREDPQLTNKLLAELPGILLWALEGWARLKKQGHFTVPASSADAVVSLERLTSPVMAFLDDECVIEPETEVPVDALFLCWKHWNEDQNRKFPGSKESFCRDVYAAASGVSKIRKRLGNSRPYHFRGIRLRNAQDGMDNDEASEEIDARPTGFWVR